ncbi:N-acetyltransferase [Acidaminobacter sp. JC074]|uniref:GNAT family N-acetyltransferase n=1 Tax=Acidaminobacter sp. JC074 TaxID=2530199 RepID=UPI001F0DE329|nr:N-acetyltransferase [Acidaminobacter sp. JC074]
MIRKVDDLKVCHQLIVESFLDVNKSLGITKENCPGNSGYLTLSQLEKQVSKGLILYGYYDPDLIACIGLMEKSHVRCKIKMLSVLPEYRNKGIGKVLMDFAETQANEKLVLGMIYENQKLYKWYEALGYKVDKIKKYRGNEFNVAYMEKKLEKNISKESI